MRRWPRLLIAAFVVGLLGFYPLLAPPAHRIDQEHYELIQNGMTIGEIESIFGQPPGNYDWAVADDSGIVIWKAVRGSKVKYVSTSFVMDSFSDSNWTVALSNKTKTRYYTSVVWNAKTWTSRHGTCSIWFDDNLRVLGRITSWGTSRVEPPWSKWWKKLFGGE